MNCLHKLQLVEAEYQRSFGSRAAIESYDLAIDSARANGYLRDQALANEQAAVFYLDWSKEKVAQAYMHDAFAAYARWGATAKLAQLERQIRQILKQALEAQP